MKTGNLDECSQDKIEHIAFCPACRKKLHLQLQGKSFSERIGEPDWDRLLKKISRAARWEFLKDKIANFIAFPFEPFPEVAAVHVRSSETSAFQLHISIFEINLTEYPQLSDTGLGVSEMAYNEETGGFDMVIGGFNPGLEGMETRMALAFRDDVLQACRIRSGSELSDLQDIEKKLQKMIVNPGRMARQLDQMLKKSLWISGRVEADNQTARSAFKIPSAWTGPLLQDGFWAILLVGPAGPAMDSTPRLR